MRILLIEDASDMVRKIASCLEAEYLIVDSALDGEQGSFLARSYEYDVVVLADDLPKKNGRCVFDEIRAADRNLPILILSTDTDLDKKINFLNAGADDYLVEPFSISELVARVKALLRRPRITRTTTYTVGDIALDSTRHLVTKANNYIHLTRKEFALLEFFLQNLNIALSRTTIMEHVWDMNADPFSNTIESHVVCLRKKIDPTNKYIMTVPGIGYKIVAP